MKGIRMIHIDFKPPNTKIWKDWVRDCELKTETELNVQGSKDPYSVIIEDLYKRDSVRKTVFFSTKGSFRGKCAFCQISLESHFPDIEHFRPKKGVTDENDKIIEIQDDSGGYRKHQGYYWLAYDWKNLLPSCNKCNRPTSEGKMGKRNRFPVAGTHATGPDDSLEAEDAYLLHPIYDHPEDHLTVDLEKDDAEWMLIPTTRRGEMTIEILSLNRRSDLREERAGAILKFQALWAQLAVPSTRKNARKKLQILYDGSEPGTLAVRILYNLVNNPISLKPPS